MDVRREHKRWDFGLTALVEVAVLYGLQDSLVSQVLQYMPKFSAEVYSSFLPTLTVKLRLVNKQ